MNSNKNFPADLNQKLNCEYREYDFYQILGQFLKRKEFFIQFCQEYLVFEMKDVGLFHVNFDFPLDFISKWKTGRCFLLIISEHFFLFYDDESV